MLRRILVFLVVATPAALIATPASAIVSTQIAVNFTMADGVTPMPVANVGVFYLPPDPDSGSVVMPMMGQGFTASAGAFSSALVTSMIPTTDLGDLGDAQDTAFNALVVAQDAAGDIAVQFEVLQLGGAATFQASVNPDLVTTPSTAARAAATTVSATLDAPDVTTNNRYVRIAALNNAAGMSVDLTYTKSASVARQTTVGGAVAAGPIGDGAPFTASGSTLEQADRSTTRDFVHTGGYHNYLWAQYKFVQSNFEVCVRTCSEFHKWTAHNWTGNLTDNNPDALSNGAVIGVALYTQPAFAPGPSNSFFTTLTPSTPNFRRDSGSRITYNFELGVAGFITIGSQSTFGSITSSVWKYQSTNCPAPKQRVIWGNNIDPASARIIQANCMVP
jgi:hypothetical protein